MTERGREIARAIGLEATDETFNPVLVDFYEVLGFLPDAIVNYLLLLGWALDDRTETFARSEMVESFSLERVNRAPSSGDPKKLMSFEARYMQALPVEDRARMALPYLVRAGLVNHPDFFESFTLLRRQFFQFTRQFFFSIVNH